MHLMPRRPLLSNGGLPSAREARHPNGQLARNLHWRGTIIADTRGLTLSEVPETPCYRSCGSNSPDPKHSVIGQAFNAHIQ